MVRPLIPINMWESRIEYLKQDHLDMVTEYFCDGKRLSSQQSQQVRERIKGHALLVASPDINLAVEFDHDEFRQYFLGDGLARTILPLSKNSISEALSILRRGILPENSQHEFIRSIKRQNIEKIIEVAELLSSVSRLDGQASYTKENCGNLTLKLLSDMDSDGLELSDMIFGIESIRDCKLRNVSFKDCYFSQSSYETTEIELCTFENCNFGQMRIHSSTIIRDNKFTGCKFDSIKVEDSSLEIWEPVAIKSYLDKNNSTSLDGTTIDSVDIELMSMDEELISVEKLLRYFMRSTHISESVIKIKLGDRSQSFIDFTLPKLIESRVIEEIENRGSGQQRRFKLGRPLQELNSHLASAQGEYEKFILGFS